MTSPPRRLQPRKQPRQVRAELTRERILDAAAHVFAEHGYAAGTTNRIADRARVSIGSLYQYFPNKDAILVELLSRHLEEGARTQVPADAEQARRPLEEIVRGMVQRSLANHQQDPRLVRLMLEEAPASRALAQRARELLGQRVGAVRALLAAHDEVAVDDLDTAAHLVVSTVELMVHQLVAAPDPVGTDRLEAELVAMVTRYLRGAPSP